MSDLASKVRVNADAPAFGPFREEAKVDAVGAITVLSLCFALAGMAFIGLAAFFTKALG